MIKGMTGFAQSSVSIKEGKLFLELRSLNHKFFEVIFHLPLGFGIFEERIKKQIQQKIKRGRITFSLNFIGAAQQKATINKKLARDYFNLINDLKRQFKLKGETLTTQILNLPGVLSLEETRDQYLNFWPTLKKALDKALDNLLKMRRREGESIYKDILEKLNVIEDSLKGLPSRAMAVFNEKRKTLLPDEFIAFLKASDINEELSRLKLHLKNMRQQLKSNESVGKELDFIAQELQREANTIGAKLPDEKISPRVVKIKSSIEKIREQLQNVE